MKIVRYLPVALLGLYLAAPGASADPISSTPDDSAYAQDDADGVPLVVRQRQPQQLSPEQIEAIHKRQGQAAQDKDWLVRGYEQQLQTHPAVNSAQDQNSNLYYELGANKELAKLAGLPVLSLDGADSASTVSSRAGTPSSEQGTNLRSDDSSTEAAPTHDPLFRPLFSSSAAPKASGSHSLYSPLSFSLTPTISFFGKQTPRTRPQPKTDQSDDSSDLDTPGLVAAEKDPLMDMSNTDLTLNVLPGETADEAKARQESNNTVELPLPMDADRLHEAQAAALSVPGAPTGTNPAQTQPTVPPIVKPVQVDDQDTPLPVSKVPPINPVRSPIANPYDILDR